MCIDRPNIPNSFIILWRGNGEQWDWQGEEYRLQKDSNYGKLFCCRPSIWLEVINMSPKLSEARKKLMKLMMMLLFLADESQCLWNEVALNEEDLSYMLDETTPIKACGDLAYHVNHSGISLFIFFHLLWLIVSCLLSFLIAECISDTMQKEPEEYKETSSQLKRRRMLQFDTQVIDSPFCNEEMSSVFLSNVNARYPFNFLRLPLSKACCCGACLIKNRLCEI